MFDKQELAVIHKALTELTIKGAEAQAMATLLAKVQEAYVDKQPKTTRKNAK